MMYPAIFIGLLTCLVTYWLSRYLTHKNVMDVPGERSSHSIEKPRGGGIAFVIGISAVLVFAWHQGHLGMHEMLAIVIPGLAIALVGLVDDVITLGLGSRLFTQVSAAAVALAVIPLPELQLSSLTLGGILLLFPLYLLGSVWFINLYNFMDGIDGIASLQAISMLLSAALILTLEQHPGQAAMLAALTTPAFGFLVWNFPLSRIFMGDVGSGYLGFILAMMACLTSATTSLTVWTWIILGALFIADSSYTLQHRMRTGQRWTQPHRLHGYQILARRFDAHAPVNGLLLAINLVYLLPLAWYATRAPEQAWIVAIAAYIPIIVGFRMLGAGKPAMDVENS